MAGRVGYVPFAPTSTYDYGPGSRISELILRAGENAARAQAAQGDIWGSAVANLGQDAGRAIEGYQAQKAEERQREGLAKRDAALFDLMGREDATVEDYARIAGPKDGIDIYQGVQATKKVAGGVTPEDALKLLPVQLAGFRKLTPEGRAAAYPSLRASVVKAGLFGEEQAPAEYSPELQPFMDEIERKLSKPEKFSPGEGERDPITGEVSIPIPAAEKVDSRSLEARYADAVARGDQATAASLLQAQKAISDAGRAPAAAKGPASLTPNAESTIINRLSTQWTKAAAPAVEIDRQVKLMDAGLAEAKKGNMAAGSQAVLVTFQKILDPTSVVRESEYARSSAGLALLSRVQGAYEKLIKGGAGVPIGELEQFSKLAKEAAKAFSGGHLDAVKKRIEATAGRYNIPIETVIEDYSFGAQSESSFGGKPVGVFKIKPAAQ